MAIIDPAGNGEETSYYTPLGMNAGQPVSRSLGPLSSNPYASFYDQGPGIASAYQKYLKRGITGTLDEGGQNLGEYQSWLGNQGYEQGIASSPEAQALINRSSAQPYAQPAQGSYEPSGQYVAPSQPASSPATPASPAPAPGGAYPGTNVFDDPATKNWEQMLNTRIQQLQTPYTPPNFQPAVDQLTGYLKQLNGPAYTPAQTDLMQTQALDPLERQRTSAQQQLTQRLASRGIGPTSGIFQSAQENLNRSFDEMRTKTQAGFATNAIGLSRQNASQAAQLAPMIAALEQGQFNTQDQRNQQAVNQAVQIPNMAWSRLTGAQQGVQPLNTLDIFKTINGMQNQGYGQDAMFMQQLMSTLVPLFGLGG